MRRALVSVLALVLLLAPVAPFAAVGGAAATPAGMATIPASNIADDAPADGDLKLTASELDGGVMASQHADSLEVVLTTADHAPSVMDSDSAAVSGDGMAVVLRDDQNSAGREVAIDAGLLQQALGYRPEAIYGTHEDGSEWTRSAEYVDGYLVFEVPHFSSNTVTFSGEVTIDAVGAANGTQFAYTVDNTSAISDPQLTITGTENVKNTTKTAQLSSGESLTQQVGGTEPTQVGYQVSGRNETVTSTAQSYIGCCGNDNRETQFTSPRDNLLVNVTISVTRRRGDTGGTTDVTLQKDDGGLNTVDSWSISDRGTVHKEVTLNEGDQLRTITVLPSQYKKVSYAYSYTEKTGTVSGSVDGYTFTQDLGGGGEWEYVTGVNPGETSAIEITSAGALSPNVTATFAERSVTSDPAVEIASSNGTQTIDYAGELPDGETIDLSSQVDVAKLGGPTTVTAYTTPPSSGPPAELSLNYSHAATDAIETSYNSSVFTERYNISHTYADANDNAQVTIPFASNRVVGVKSVEYRVDGSSWGSVQPENYRFDGTTLTVYLDDATGGVDAGQTVDVRATGRKISVENGAVTVTDPTAPGEELDTELRVDERTSDFAVNVGPTDDGDRVHYAYSPYFPTEDYVVIQANGDQDLHLPNAVTGDRVRVRHLDTRVVAERGDVRIDVVSAGENPELDVSPGPGGSGDPVTVEYYNTETGVTYLLNSLTRSIVVDSDVAESPAIFEDDDSEDTWAILRDSGVTSSSSSSGAVGQFTERASGAVGSISLPIDGSGLGQLALVGVLGLGGLLVLRRINPFGSSSSTPTRSSRSTASGSGRLADLGSSLGGLGRTAASAGSRAAQTTGSGLLAALRRLLAYFGQITTIILGNRRASITAGVVAAIVAARVGLVSLPEGTGILIVVAGVPVATWLILRQNNAASTRVWLGSTIAAVILGLEFVAPGTVQTAIEQLTSETVAPLLILVAAGGLYLWYRARQSDRPQIIIGGDSE